MTHRFDPDHHHRRSIRLPEYDYSQAGAYFVTLCTKGRECVLADRVAGGIVLDVWRALPGWFPTIELDEFVVMPNHIHFIVWLFPPDNPAEATPNTNDDVGATLAVAPDNPAEATPNTNDDVGATLAVAPDNPAEATPNTNDDVGATLAVAHDTGDAHGAGAGAIRAGASPAPTDTPWVIPSPDAVNLRPALGDVVGAFKSLVFTVYLNWIEAHDAGRRAKFWQRNYYEHIIRDERELGIIRRYIRDNPLKWVMDLDNPANWVHRRPPDSVDAYLQEAGL